MVSLVDESLQEIILAAFLAGVKAGVIEEGVPLAKKTAKQVTKRAIRGRSKGDVLGKARRRVSAYQTAYGKNFKRLAPKNKKANGSWKKDGFKRTQKAAHAATRKEMKK